MNTSRKKELKIIFASAAIICLCLVLLGSATTAWYYYNKDLDSKNQKIKLDGKEMSLTGYTAYFCNRDVDADNYQTNSKPGVGTYGSKEQPNNSESVITLSLRPYDSILTRKNQNTGVVYVFTLEDVPKISTNIGVDLELLTEKQEGTKYTSDVVKVKMATEAQINKNLSDDKKLSGTSGADVVYPTAKTYFDNVTGTAFTNNQVVAQLGITAEDVPDSGTIRVYVYVDYDTALLSAAGFTNFGNIDIQYTEDLKIGLDLMEISFVDMSIDPTPTPATN